MQIAHLNPANTNKINAYVATPLYELLKYDCRSKLTDNLGGFNRIELTNDQKTGLRQQFEVSWDSHVKSNDCEFGCGNYVWPHVLY